VVTDHLGTPRLLVDEAGDVAWKAQLDIYGVARQDVMRTGCPWRWPGQYEDEETGLYYNRFRYYDPEAGRYVSPDPIGLAGGLALYGYVEDPLDRMDPFGLAECGKIDPKKVRFSQESILSTFKDGSSVLELAEALKKGRVFPESIPAIKTFLKEGLLYTLDNRRLAAFRLSGTEVPFVTAAAAEVARDSWKFTTKTQGASILMRDIRRWIR
jgi:RHS repeat-associated protein